MWVLLNGFGTGIGIEIKILKGFGNYIYKWVWGPSILRVPYSFTS